MHSSSLLVHWWVQPSALPATTPQPPHRPPAAGRALLAARCAAEPAPAPRLPARCRGGHRRRPPHPQDAAPACRSAAHVGKVAGRQTPACSHCGNCGIVGSPPPKYSEHIHLGSTYDDNLDGVYSPVFTLPDVACPLHGAVCRVGFLSPRRQANPQSMRRGLA